MGADHKKESMIRNVNFGTDGSKKSQNNVDDTEIGFWLIVAARQDEEDAPTRAEQDVSQM